MQGRAPIRLRRSVYGSLAPGICLSMRQYIIRRLLATIPLLFVISFFCFIFINLIPSDPAEVALRVRQTPVITPEAIAQVRAELGLDRPFFVRYVDWVWNCLQGDFGVSYTNPSRTVLGELGRCLPATLSLAGLSLVYVIVLSLPIGFLSAVYLVRLHQARFAADERLGHICPFDPPGLYGGAHLHFDLYPPDPQQHARKHA